MAALAGRGGLGARRERPRRRPSTGSARSSRRSATPGPPRGSRPARTGPATCSSRPISATFDALRPAIERLARLVPLTRHPDRAAFAAADAPGVAGGHRRRHRGRGSGPTPPTSARRRPSGRGSSGSWPRPKGSWPRPGPAWPMGRSRPRRQRPSSTAREPAKPSSSTRSTACASGSPASRRTAVDGSRTDVGDSTGDRPSATPPDRPGRAAARGGAAARLRRDRADHRRARP